MTFSNWSPTRMVIWWLPGVYSGVPSESVVPIRSPTSSAKRKPACGASLRPGKFCSRSRPADAVAVGEAARRSQCVEAGSQAELLIGQRAVDQQLDVGHARIVVGGVDVEGVAGDDVVDATVADCDRSRRSCRTSRPAGSGTRSCRKAAGRRWCWRIWNCEEFRYTTWPVRLITLRRDAVQAVEEVGGVELVAEAGRRRVGKPGMQLGHGGTRAAVVGAADDHAVDHDVDREDAGLAPAPSPGPRRRRCRRCRRAQTRRTNRKAPQPPRRPSPRTPGATTPPSSGKPFASSLQPPLRRALLPWRGERALTTQASQAFFQVIR